MNFVNPLFLIGALAAGIPVLLHLIKRAHARKIEFPTLMFLRRISKRTIRYQKLRHLLLLLLRILAFLLIALAFARPYREKAQAAAAAVGRITTAHIIVLDNSLSMGYQDRWDRAKKAASEFIRKSEPNDKFAILEFSDRTLAITQFTNDASDARSQIERLELSDQSTKYGQALRAAEKFAFDAGTGKRVVYLISDFQKNGWTTEDRDFRFGAGIALQHVDVGSNDFSNLAFRDVRVSELDQGGGNAIGIKASVANFGNLDRKNVRVNLTVDGRSIAEKRIDVARGGSQGIDFQLPGLTSGTHPVMLEIEDSYLTRDNRFHMTIEARGNTPVLVIENNDSKRKRSPSFFLSKALNVDAVSPYRMTSESPQSLAITGGLLIWNDVPGGSAATQKKLQDFVKAGGGLLVVAADSIQPSDFNRTFGSWLPVKIEEPAVPESYSRARPVENYVLMTDVRMDHPIFRPFSRPNSGSFSSARFFRHARVSAGSGAEVPARFDNGDPALVSVPVEKGRVLIFASSADDSANDLPLKAVYAPFWQQMLHYLENFQERRHWLDVGDTMAPKKLLVDAALRQTKGNVDLSGSVAVLDPARQRISAAPGSDSIAVDKAGFYEIRAMHMNATVAVNPIPRESDLTHGNAEGMTAGWISSKSASFARDEHLSPEEEDRRQRIWALLLIAAALFLVSEFVLSNFELRNKKEV
jgi:hypothetical protein